MTRLSHYILNTIVLVGLQYCAAEQVLATSGAPRNLDEAKNTMMFSDTARTVWSWKSRDEPCVPQWDTEIGNLGMTGGPVGSFADTFTGATVGSDGAALYVGSGADQSVWKWDGASWALLSGLPWGGVDALAVHNDGAGNALYAGGGFGQTGGPWYIARWNGSEWEAVPLFDPNLPNFSGSIRALIEFNGTLYAGGAIHINPDHIYVARWDGDTWEYVQNDLNDAVWAFAVFNGDLYAGGAFWYVAGGDPARGRIARWNASSWAPVGTGITGGTVRALGVFDDGSGPALYAGGNFTAAGGTPANNIAKWNGSSWSALGSGTDGEVSALAVSDDGTGPALYAGGHFANAGGASANHIAKWNGSQWSPLHCGISYAGPLWAVQALTAADDGSTGPALFVGGRFQVAGGKTANHIAKWRCAPFDLCGPGNFDCDCYVDLDDLNVFLAVLLGLDTEPIHIQLADVNGDGAADGKDIQLFVNALLDQ